MHSSTKSVSADVRKTLVVSFKEKEMALENSQQMRFFHHIYGW